MTHHTFQRIRRGLALSIISALAACGGSPAAEAPATPSTPTITVTPHSIKTLHFSWADGGDETEYHVLEDPDGNAGYTRVATAPANSTSHDLTVLLPERVNARYVLQACNTGGCTDSATVGITGSLNDAIGYVKASNAEGGAWFGFALAVSGDGRTMAIGARAEDSAATGIDGDQTSQSASDSGAVYVFARNGSTWVQQAYVKASNTNANDWFGTSVALSADGNTLVVGAFNEDSAAPGVGGDQSDNTANDSGAVYVFTRSGSAWSQQAYIKASNPEAVDRFGSSVALSASGDTLAVGAPDENSAATGIGGNQGDNAAPDSGAVYVFARAGSAWSQQAYVKASNTGADDRFGEQVALSGDGNTLAVGTRNEDSNATGIGGDQTDNTANGAGAVYVFAHSAGTWSQQAYVKASNAEATDFFGTSVSLSTDGHTLAVGAPREDSHATGIDGLQGDNSVANSGAVYVFVRSGVTWSQQAYLKASNTGTDDAFGRSVALSSDGTTLMVGAPGEASSATGIGGDQSNNTALESGAVYVFRHAGGAWQQRSYLKASNPGVSDVFGTSVALSADGQLLAVGAHWERSNATGIGGDQTNDLAPNSGAVYLY